MSVTACKKFVRQSCREQVVSGRKGGSTDDLWFDAPKKVHLATGSSFSKLEVDAGPLVGRALNLDLSLLGAEECERSGKEVVSGGVGSLHLVAQRRGDGEIL